MTPDAQSQQELHNNSIHRNDSMKEYVPLKAIGNYTFTQSIGKGSMGKVKLGVHNVTGEKVSSQFFSFSDMIFISIFRLL